MELLSDLLLNNQKILWWFIFNIEKSTKKWIINIFISESYLQQWFLNTNMNNLWLTEIKGKHERLIAQHCTLNK